MNKETKFINVSNPIFIQKEKIMKTTRTRVVDGKIIDIDTVTTQEIIGYLESKLGFHIGCDFTRWIGISPDHCYVRMRVVFKVEDIIESEPPSSPLLESLLKKHAVDGGEKPMIFKQEIMDKLKPYMYSKERFDYIRSHPAVMDKLAIMGVYGERLNEIEKNATLKHVKEADVFLVYLKPEKILCDVKGWQDLMILDVKGISSDTIRFEVANC